jgi:hypothetical protein
MSCVHIIPIDGTRKSGNCIDVVKLGSYVVDLPVYLVLVAHVSFRIPHKGCISSMVALVFLRVVWLTSVGDQRAACLASRLVLVISVRETTVICVSELTVPSSTNTQTI